MDKYVMCEKAVYYNGRIRVTFYPVHSSEKIDFKNGIKIAISFSSFP